MLADRLQRFISILEGPLPYFASAAPFVTTQKETRKNGLSLEISRISPLRKQQTA
jgi:hypothetical protein